MQIIIIPFGSLVVFTYDYIKTIYSVIKTDRLGIRVKILSIILCIFLPLIVGLIRILLSFLLLIFILVFYNFY